jgi:predicted nuclease of restriction endonuclease-like (RecB) superfamily
MGPAGTAGTALSELSGIIIVVNTPELALPDDYPHLLAELKAQIRSAQWTATRVVNTQLVELYWAIGKAILDRQNAAGWGAKVIDQLAVDLSLAFPDGRGFSRRNLHYMRRLAEAWPAPAFVQQPAAQMPWGHLMVVLDKIEEPAAREWYVRQCVAGVGPATCS